MSEYGFQCFDSNGSLLWDHSAMFTRILGKIDLPFMNLGSTSHSEILILPQSGTVNNLDLTEGTPFGFIVPHIDPEFPMWNGAAGTGTYTAMCDFPSPTVSFTNDSMTWQFGMVAGYYPDDIPQGAIVGFCELYYGVYTG
ncbi:hypothetical protein [Brenneria tiliae]|uniref:Uncharacterized protein n=1 Tax=Brenneria tiliae TaxID=2914984 RepID=A0ABT0MRH1_9GAMM|nr:hypothetical protein [Brenneria tiliae]MCL2892464.1 hypothetical protein [Brenneria tiliae]